MPDEPKKPEFEIGQVVVAMHSHGHQITEGKQYKVTHYQPEVYDPTFTWPAYVTVIGDFGRRVQCHTYRFRALQEGEAEQVE